MLSMVSEQAAPALEDKAGTFVSGFRHGGSRVLLGRAQNNSRTTLGGAMPPPPTLFRSPEVVPLLASQFALGHTGQSHEPDHAVGVFENKSGGSVVDNGAYQMPVGSGNAPLSRCTVIAR